MLSWSVRHYNPDTWEKTIFSDEFRLKHRLLSALLHVPSDPNKLEYYNYTRLPDSLKEYFPLTTYHENRLFMTPVREIDWSTSPSLEHYVWLHGKISEKWFWDHIDTICTLMNIEDVFLFDFVAQNIVVQTQADWTLRPWLVDCKRVWIHLFPRQIPLWFHSQRVAKLLRAKRRLEAFAKG